MFALLPRKEKCCLAATICWRQSPFISVSPPPPPHRCRATVVCHFTGLENISFKLNATAVQPDMLMAGELVQSLCRVFFFSFLFKPAC